MKLFLTGATGFIGSYLVPELIHGGHQVVGLSRSDAGLEALARAGAEAVRGDVNDLCLLRRLANSVEGVIHAAFNHDFAKLREHSEEDRRVVQALGEALAGSRRPLIVTSGTGLVRSRSGGPAMEADAAAGSAEFPRGATEEAADALIEAGANVMVVRLAQVHDTLHQGRLAEHIRLAREKGFVAYVGDGTNRLPAVHVSDAVRLYRLALEGGEAGERYHAVAEEGVALRAIAEVLGATLGLPVLSIPPEEAPVYFGPLAPLTQIDLAASSARTRQRLGWEPSGPDLLSDLRATRPAST